MATALGKARPQIMPSLYVSLAVLQMYDWYSTLRGLRDGAREMNPIVAHAAGQPVVLWTVKAASTAATIYCAEHLWRAHRRGRNRAARCGEQHDGRDRGTQRIDRVGRALMRA